MMGSYQPLGFHSPRGEWGRWVEMDRPIGFLSLTEELESTEYGIKSTTWSTGSTKDMTRLTT
jgi:hypothetical protein